MYGKVSLCKLSSYLPRYHFLVMLCNDRLFIKASNVLNRPITWRINTTVNQIWKEFNFKCKKNKQIQCSHNFEPRCSSRHAMLPQDYYSFWVLSAVLFNSALTMRLQMTLQLYIYIKHTIQQHYMWMISSYRY